MRSVPLVLTWELLARRGWYLPASILGANLLPVLLFGALRMQGFVESTDPAMLAMQVMLVQINMFTFGAALLEAPGPVSRLFVLPVSTATLVGWSMLPAMLLMAIENLVSTLFLNSLFDLGWPLWGPTLFAAVGLAGVQAAVWITDKSGWVAFAMIVVGAPLALWFKSRVGPMFSMPTHLWHEVTAGEVFTMLAFAGVSYTAAVIGMARRRCGEPLPSLGIIAWFERVFDPPAEFGPPFRSPIEAHFWFEWRNKGWVLPSIVWFSMLIGLTVWIFSPRDWKELLEGLTGGGAILSMMGFVGLALGSVGSNDQTIEMGHFLATRPLTSVELSRTLLKVISRSLLKAWTIWAIPFTTLWLVLRIQNSMPEIRVLNELGWWVLPASLLSCWLVTSNLATMVMTGRSTRIAQFALGSFAAFVGWTALSKLALTIAQREQANCVIVIVIGVALIVGTAWAFVTARRNKLLESPIVLAASVTWLFLAGIIVSDAMQHPNRSTATAAILLGLAALVVAPLATAPLALTWNRNR